MPRQRSSGSRSSGNRRSSSSRSAPSRSASTTSAPRKNAQPPAVQPQAPPPAVQNPGNGGGLLANIASTAAGVALGHTMANAVTGFFGGNSEAPVEEIASPVAPQQQQARANGACDADAQAFARCISENPGNTQSCNWYMEQFNVLSMPRPVADIAALPEERQYVLITGRGPALL
ncbi:Mitochondrial intermembrane space cysteine motif-containing protein MIX17 [Neolecta irregularis DAH-3]|uniref:Mitochondrial intermembrane space cysteine motif-containing protein MIX17 n=1 Tax=Neolecta irregularis (strain DAH-3) TaxID=1198029 RepID=A0A1U7LKC1_NEOID|nr:Mitochondrial intermembrane space cysteine motif-containing protein MIX17 [Neolecta irregularis DAH-3]|eukprot:OLL23089.1 Mitochondrial intermembrane space cysteine motif-containing protein MIX17 [Neolecta irregularis DAH-3]